MSRLDDGITSSGQATRGKDKFGKINWKATAPDVAMGKDPLSKTGSKAVTKGVSTPKMADSDMPRNKTA